MLPVILAGGAVLAAPVTQQAQQALWNSYMHQFNKTYSSPAEESTRFNIFLKNLDLIDLRNAREGKDGARHGWTKFIDLSPDEFRLHLGYVAPRASSARLAEEVDLPELAAGESAKKDWTGVYTTKVKDQGQCGSCWAFSATEQIESDAMRELGETYELSPQQIVSCDRTDDGCQGGNTETAYSYVKKSAGIVLSSEYPYKSGKSGNTGNCIPHDLKRPVIEVSLFKTVKRSTSDADGKGVEAAMAKYVGETGPLSICVDAESWQTYQGGVMKHCGTQLDHCVQAVGIDTKAGVWKVRNSWNTDWGEDGFIRLAYGHNTCGLTHDATWVTVKGGVTPSPAPNSLKLEASPAPTISLLDDKEPLLKGLVEEDP